LDAPFFALSLFCLKHSLHNEKAYKERVQKRWGQGKGTKRDDIINSGHSGHPIFPFVCTRKQT